MTAPTHHAGRFRLAYLGLAACVIAAAVVFGYELQPSPPPPQTAPWSNWAPSAPGVDAVLNIADHVGAEYHLKDGRQLSLVKAGYPGHAGTVDPSAQTEIEIPVSTIALATTDASGSTTYSLVPAAPSTIEYQLCGPGPHCQIPASDGGSTARVQAALRREALELALYTFRYVPDVSQVVELLPSATPKSPGRALLLDRIRLGPAIVAPLSATLPARIDATHQQLVDTLTSPALAYTYQQQFDGTYQMVLSMPR